MLYEVRNDKKFKATFRSVMRFVNCYSEMSIQADRINSIILSIIILVTLAWYPAKGDSSFTLSNGTLSYCRLSEDCPERWIYHGNDCSCSPPNVCCVNSGITRYQCVEYGYLVFAEKYGAALDTRRVLANVSDCRIETPLIVGGEKAKPKEFPHMVAIGYGDSGSISWLCGGTLISKNHVLSAAHCNSTEDDHPAQWALVGALYLEDHSEDDEREQYKIIDRILHPRFKPPSRYHDIAIFKLDREVLTSASVRPACLNVDPDIPYKKLTATGWGKLNYTAIKGNEYLMKVRLDVIDREECSKTYKIDFGRRTLLTGIEESQLCAGYLKGGKDTCQGDSGGPLQIELRTPYCMYSVVGVTSFGKYCGYANTTAVYTKVSFYIPWIESVVWS